MVFLPDNGGGAAAGRLWNMGSEGYGYNAACVHVWRCG